MHKIQNSLVKQWKHSGFGFIPASININCSFCGEKATFSIDSYGRSESSVIVSSQCPSCAKVMRFYIVDPAKESEDKHQHGGIYAYPPPNQKNPMRGAEEMPRWLLEAYVDVIKVFNANIMSSTAISCRRVLEGICRSQLPDEKASRSLDAMLHSLPNHVELKSTFTSLIDTVRKHDNIGEEDISVDYSITREEAAMLIELLEYLIEYLYVLPAKVEKLQARLLKIKNLKAEMNKVEDAAAAELPPPAGAESDDSSSAQQASRHRMRRRTETSAR